MHSIGDLVALMIIICRLELTVEPWMTRLFEALKDWFHLDRISMEQPCGSVDVNRMKELSLEEKEENEVFSGNCLREKELLLVVK